MPSSARLPLRARRTTGCANTPSRSVGRAAPSPRGCCRMEIRSLPRPRRLWPTQVGPLRKSGARLTDPISGSTPRQVSPPCSTGLAMFGTRMRRTNTWSSPTYCTLHAPMPSWLSVAADDTNPALRPCGAAPLEQQSAEPRERSGRLRSNGLVQRGPEVVHELDRGRHGRTDLGEQDADDLVGRVGVRRRTGAAVPAELADRRVVTPIGAYGHSEAPAALLPLAERDVHVVPGQSLPCREHLGREAVGGHQLHSRPGQDPLALVYAVVQQHPEVRVVVVSGGVESASAALEGRRAAVPAALR